MAPSGSVTKISDEPPRLVNIVQGEYENMESSFGSIIVTLQRGHCGWLDGLRGTSVEGKDGRSDPSQYRPFRNKTFKRLQSRYGLKYLWEFRPRSPALLDQIEHARERADGGSVLDKVDKNKEGEYPLLPDPDFKAHRLERTRIRNEMSQAWKLDKSPIRVPITCLPLNTERKDKRKRKAPPVCHCEDEKCKRQKTRHILDADKVTANATTGASMVRYTTRPSVGKFDRTVDRARTSSEDIDAESTAPVCGSCAKVKKPPRGKKLAWRSARNKWMYVHPDAPDEEELEEESEDEEMLAPEQELSTAPAAEIYERRPEARPFDEDDDDDEELPRSKTEINAQNGGIAGCAPAPDDTGVTPPSMRSTFLSRSVMPLSDTLVDQAASGALDDGAPRQSEVHARLSENPEGSVDKAEHRLARLTSTSPQPPTPSTHTNGQFIEPSIATPSEILSKTEDTESQRNDTRVRSAAHNDETQVELSPVSRKHLKSPKTNQRPEKKAKIDVDITLDDDEPSKIKAEPSEAKLKPIIIIDDEPNNEDEIRERLEDIEMEQEELRAKDEMQREELRLQRETQQKELRLKRERMLLQRKLRRINQK